MQGSRDSCSKSSKIQNDSLKRLARANQQHTSRWAYLNFLRNILHWKSLHYPQTTLRTTLKSSKMLCKKNVTLFSLIRFCLSLLFLTFSSNRDFSFAARIFFSFWSESFSIVVISFLLLWEFFLSWKFIFCCENFCFAVKNFLLLWEFLWCCEKFSPENSSVHCENLFPQKFLANHAKTLW